MTKSEIRKMIKEQKKQLSTKEINEFSSQIAKRLMDTDMYKKASVIYPYVAYNQEVITNEIILDALKSGKRVAVPKTYTDYMEFLYITDLNQLEPGAFNIPEPITTEIANEPEVLIIMPGIAFDPEFNRIGYGGGFYDKYLANHPDTNFTKVAVTYDFQIVDHLETEPHDEKIDAIITPTRIFMAP